MADFNINSQCTSNGKNFPKAQPSISFHVANAQAPCTLNFTPFPGNCFEVASATANPDVSLPVKNNNATTVTPTCAGSLPGTTGDAFDITFSGPVGEKKGGY